MKRGELYRTRERVPERGGKPSFYVICDFLTWMFKTKLTNFVAMLSTAKMAELNRALVAALEWYPLLTLASPSWSRSRCSYAPGRAGAETSTRR